MAALLLAAHATVTVAHSRTRDLPAECRRADIIVAAVGKFVDAGFTHVALVQVGDAQRELCEAYAGKLGAALREL